ncbi:MAG: hypothetical protein U0360_05625 [Dehalococcoidia bacterium]
MAPRRGERRRLLGLIERRTRAARGHAAPRPDGALRWWPPGRARSLLEVQRSGRTQGIEAYLNGDPDLIGARLGQ